MLHFYNDITDQILPLPGLLKKIHIFYGKRLLVLHYPGFLEASFEPTI